MHAALSKGRFENRNQVFRSAYSSSMGPVSLGVFDKVGVSETEPEICKSIRPLFPANHPVPLILDDENDQIEIETDGRLQVLRVHHEAPVATNRHDAFVSVQHRGHHG